MTTYNPVPSLTLRDKLSEIYYSSAAGQFVVELTFFIGGCGIIAAVVFVAAA